MTRCPYLSDTNVHLFVTFLPGHPSKCVDGLKEGEK